MRRISPFMAYSNAFLPSLFRRRTSAPFCSSFPVTGLGCPHRWHPAHVIGLIDPDAAVDQQLRNPGKIPFPLDLATSIAV
ncbi:MAG: hypothetical protein PVJ84_19450, partial [Desulfobacteraceae bacterium]